MQKQLKCPKCQNIMKKGKLNGPGAILIRKEGDLWGDGVATLYCQNCGYIEWYIEKKLNE